MTSTLDDVVTDLTIRTHAFVDGRYVDAASGETFDCINTATGCTIASVASCDAEDVDRAVRGARGAIAP
jgi:acyl-CoA reductase-like NAD-dependent aldehyde dehydrogenase